AYSAQVLVAVHLPVRPQVAGASSGQSPCESCPAAIAVQVPRVPGRTHEWHGSAQSLSQQIPSTQCCESQPVLAVQALPLGPPPRTPPSLPEHGSPTPSAS